MKPLFLTLLLALMSVAQSVYAQTECGRTIESKLAELKVEKSSVKEFEMKKYGSKKYGLKDQGFQGYRAWFRLGSCQGYLVMDLTDTCFITTVYTTGSCRVTGVPPH